MKPILVASHSRSGTHFLINSIGFNFGRREIPVNVPLGGSMIMECLRRWRRKRVILKSHHQWEHFMPFSSWLRRHYHVFYIVRHPCATLWSFQRYFSVHPHVANFPKPVNGIGDLLSYDPSEWGFDRHYSLRVWHTFPRRWSQHVTSWMASGVPVFTYESLYREHDRQLHRLSHLLGESMHWPPARPDLTHFNVAGWRGTPDHWKDGMSLYEARYILRETADARHALAVAGVADYGADLV